MSTSLQSLTLEFLAWVARQPRSYTETMEAWRTSCPRLSVWEDASRDGLVTIEGAAPQPRVVLTPRGKALLAAGR
jgi:hypothetical protein